MEPLDPYINSSTPWRSRCMACGTIGSPRLSAVRHGQGGCRPCGYSQRKVANKIPDRQAIAEMNAAQLEPLESYPGAHEPWRCRCIKCGTIGTPMLSSIRHGQGGCVPCGHRRTRLALSMSDSDAISIMRAANLEPLDPYPGARARWKSRCTVCGEVGYPWLSAIRSGAGGCKPCGVAKRVNNRRLPQAQAVIEMRRAGLEPLDPYPGLAQTPWRCRCNTCGTVGEPTLNSIRSGQGGCKPCGYAKASATRRTPELQAIIEMRRAGLEPLKPFIGVDSPWRSRCLVCGSIGSPRLSSVRNNRGGCHTCGRVRAAENCRVPDKVAIAEMRAACLIPLEPYPGAHAPWRCLCTNPTCGAIVFPRLTVIRSGRGGCRYCAKLGFDWAGPALIYLLTSPLLHAHKIGITGVATTRLAIFERNGWKPCHVVPIITGEAAYAVEQAVLARLDDMNVARPFLSRKKMPMGGYTETVDASAVSISYLYHLMRMEITSLMTEIASSPGL